MLLDEAIDRSLQIDHRVEHAVFRRWGVSLAKKPSTAARRWNELEGPSLMPRQPCADFRLLVGRMIVEDDVNDIT